MSMLSFEPAATTVGWFASIATAGSFCLFLENGPAGLPTVTSVSPPAPAAGPAPAIAVAIASDVATASAAVLRDVRMIPLSWRRSGGKPDTPATVLR